MKRILTEDMKVCLYTLPNSGGRTANVIFDTTENCFDFWVKRDELEKIFEGDILTLLKINKKLDKDLIFGDFIDINKNKIECYNLDSIIRINDDVNINYDFNKEHFCPLKIWITCQLINYPKYEDRIVFEIALTENKNELENKIFSNKYTKENINIISLYCKKTADYATPTGYNIVVKYTNESDPSFYEMSLIELNRDYIICVTNE